MKENITERYRKGETIPSSDFNSKEGLEFFGNVVYKQHQRDHATAQFDLNGKLHWRKVRPTCTPEEEHLKRKTDAQVRQERDQLGFARELLRREMRT